MSAELGETQPLPEIIRKGDSILFVSFPDPEWFLNERERKMVLLILSGFSQAEIARRWGLGRPIVEGQIASLTRRAREKIGIDVDFFSLPHVLKTLGKISVSEGFSPREKPFRKSV